ncbi:MAG: PaaI family thioesterase [Burkholderiales bacterium]|nr:PaaI family thioesterase [Burkholderiales bacterium]
MAVDAGKTVRNYGVTPLDQVRGMSGVEFLQAWIDGRLPSPPISRVFDFDAVTVEKGRIVFAGIPDGRFYNPIGTVHGGWAATVLDSCMACAVHSTLEAGQGYTTLEIKINYVRAMTDRTGRVEAEGKVVHVGKQVATAEGWLRDSQGRIVAHGSTTCMVFS